MKPLILRGKNAFSQFRIDALVKQITDCAPRLGVSGIDAEFVYFLECKSDLSDEVLTRSFALLGAVDVIQGTEFSGDTGFVVLPRKGTISPWSSKATDIFHNCGLLEVARVERGTLMRLVSGGAVLDLEAALPALPAIHDRMTEGVYRNVEDMFAHMEPRPLVSVNILGGGKNALQEANVSIGLALSDDEIDYLYDAYSSIQRNPTDAELVMFGQVNSEHCRHKIFNGDWIIDGREMTRSLFAMIRNTHEKNPDGTLVAYSDNSAVIEGFPDAWLEVRPGQENAYGYRDVNTDIVMKVETHNHPTAICPYPGASTGIGGEIRDEAATGTGARSKAGMSGFMVSNLRVPGFIMPWEKDYAEFPRRLATPLQIMTEGPIGGAGFGNEFGRPQLFGFFRTYEEEYLDRYRGYHKPIMIAGGMGNIKRDHHLKKEIEKGAYVIQLGGPAMRIGLGGGTASSMDTGSNVEDLDFDSVQRDNPEMQRRCQGVVDACIALDADNPIVSIHDLGAGGLCNGCPELISEIGGSFWLRKVHVEEKSMSPMEIWCCEAQERYVLAVASESLDMFTALCERERCPVAVIGEATGDDHLTLYDEHFDNNPIDLELQLILGKPPKMLRDVTHVSTEHEEADLSAVDLCDAIGRVLRMPSVANKTFLVTIADRTVMGLTARDQMVGPYQAPVSDVAVSAMSYRSTAGSAMAVGERPVVAVVSAPASGRMAVAEALTNICAADIGDIGKVKLSANWMCACGEDGEDANLYDTVEAVGMEFCPALGISIPVGKDSLSMRTLWEESDGKERKMVAPLSLVVSSFAPVRDVRLTLTPDLKRVEDSRLIVIDLGRGQNRLGCSALAQAYNQVGGDHADSDDPALLRSFFTAVQELIGSGLILAYHDRSDGGLAATLLEMSIAGRQGVDVRLDDLGDAPVEILFAEELGAVLQVPGVEAEKVMQVLSSHGLDDVSHLVGVVKSAGKDNSVIFRHGGEIVYTENVNTLSGIWSELTFQMQSHRDNPECAREEFEGLQREDDPGLQFELTYDPEAPPVVTGGGRAPRIAVLREQGINGHMEMAAAFDTAGFTSIDVHMTDLFAGRVDLSDFRGLVACGGFSYGDVLGAGSGWAKSILFNQTLKEMFTRFFAREDTFSLGICNGCQMLSQLKGIIPGAEHWPEFVRNRSEQFEARYVTVEILDSPSIFFKGMNGSRLGIPVAHGEGRVQFESSDDNAAVLEEGLFSVRYVDNDGVATERYPFNPNGSPGGMTGITTADGRVTIMMPHPERVFRSLQASYAPPVMFPGEAGPWLRMFQNARMFAD